MEVGVAGRSATLAATAAPAPSSVVIAHHRAPVIGVPLNVRATALAWAFARKVAGVGVLVRSSDKATV